MKLTQAYGLVIIVAMWIASLVYGIYKSKTDSYVGEFWIFAFVGSFLFALLTFAIYLLSGGTL